MYSLHQENLPGPPYDPTHIYQLQLGVCRPPRYSLDSFFLATLDGTTLLPAEDTLPRFITLLGAELPSLVSYACYNDLLALYNHLLGH